MLTGLLGAGRAGVRGDTARTGSDQRTHSREGLKGKASGAHGNDDVIMHSSEFSKSGKTGTAPFAT